MPPLTYAPPSKSQKTYATLYVPLPKPMSPFPKPMLPNLCSSFEILKKPMLPFWGSMSPLCPPETLAPSPGFVTVAKESVA